MSERSKALLAAASTIYAGCLCSDDLKPMEMKDLRVACVNDAYALLAAIEQREKALYGTREPPCSGCGQSPCGGRC